MNKRSVVGQQRSKCVHCAADFVWRTCWMRVGTRAAVDGERRGTAVASKASITFALTTGVAPVLLLPNQQQLVRETSRMEQ